MSRYRDYRAFYCTATDIRKYVFSKRKWLEDFSPAKVLYPEAVAKHNALCAEKFFSEEIVQVKAQFSGALTRVEGTFYRGASSQPQGASISLKRSRIFVVFGGCENLYLRGMRANSNAP